MKCWLSKLGFGLSVGVSAPAPGFEMCSHLVFFCLFYLVVWPVPGLWVVTLVTVVYRVGFVSG